MLWLCCCICCCVCCHRAAARCRKSPPRGDSAADDPEAADPSAVKLERGSQVRVTVAGRMSQPPPPPPPPGGDPGISALAHQESRWIEHTDPSTGDKYYESEQNGAVTWDPPEPHKIVRDDDDANAPAPSRWL